MKSIFIKYKEVISYIFFGICTTIVNIIVYYFCSHLMCMGTTSSTIVSWVLSVAFAYITNKLWVFEDKNNEIKTVIKECIAFFSCRLATGIIDLVIMIVFVEMLLFNDVFIKIISNIVVIVINYIASKLLIFKTR